MNATRKVNGSRAPLPHAAEQSPVEPMHGRRGHPHGVLAIRLTPREREVLALLCQGFPNKLIQRRLRISAGTVKTHVGRILRELGVSSRLQAVVAAREWGLLRDASGSPESRRPPAARRLEQH